MSAASVAVSLLLAGLLVFAAVRKLTHRPAVVASYARAGVPESWLDRLALILLVAAAALALGLIWAPLGVAAAAGVLCYFAVAVTFHLRARDTAQLATPVGMAMLAAAALALRLSTL